MKIVPVPLVEVELEGCMIPSSLFYFIMIQLLWCCTIEKHGETISRKVVVIWSYFLIFISE